MKNCTGIFCPMQYDKVDPATCPCVSYCPQATPPKTRADRIRAMTDEELAELLTDVAKKSADKLCESLKSVEVDLSNCNFHILYEAHLDWLKQEVDG